MVWSILRGISIIALFRWVKTRAYSLAWLLFVSFVAFDGHAEYMRYVELTGNKKYLVVSYAIKYTLLLLAIFLIFRILRASRNKLDGTEKLKNKKSRTKTAMSAVNKAAPCSERSEEEDDGFDFIRRKASLQSRADKILDRE